MKWITRDRPKIDRIACPWLIKNFVDKNALIIYAPAEKVKEQAKKLKAIPFDVPDVEFSHHDDKCTFDYIIEKYKITDAAVHTLAVIVRGPTQTGTTWQARHQDCGLFLQDWLTILKTIMNC
jgi:hypothetical protein